MSGDHTLPGSKRHIIVLSDIHLGTDVPTVWFQPSVHGEPLDRILRWVVEQAAHIRELVLLGDVVDLWTYPASMVPPTFADIVAAHPDVLGPDGSIAACLDALDGAVTYIPGNHDMGVTAEEAAMVHSGRSGRALRFAEGVYRPTDDVLLEHGHHHTLFNAPSELSPWAPLPLGYFVTRAVATAWTRDLGPGQTVADLAGQGAPNGLDLGALGAVAGGIGAASIAAGLIDIVSGTTKVTLDEPILMPDGSTATLREARREYIDVWTRWAETHGGGIVGQGVAYRSTMADADGTYLGWFAQRRALEHGADLVVMGHTHAPIGGLEDSLVEYVNSGFDCPSLPDQQRDVDPQHVTFVVVDTEPEGADAAVWAVGDAIEPMDAPRTRVVGSRGHDYSCYVVLDNTAGAHDLELVDHGAAHGTWVVPPPALVAAGTEGRFWLQDLLGAAGSDGWATYRRTGVDADPVEVRFSCPTVGTNSCSGVSTYATRSGSEEWRDQRVAHWGHPFSVAFEVR
ncbi:MAG: metallophosphoesterase [Acidimicrobiales bacterium]